MTFEVLLADPLLYLPITQEYESFKKSISDVLSKFLAKVELLDDHPLDIPDVYIDTTFIKSVQNKFIKGLLKTIDLYYDGQPAKAYQNLNETLNSELKNFKEVLKIREYSLGESFYRMRLKKENFPLSRVEMFHIPFQFRSRVDSQRYSIPGYPCLYLGRTLYGCWEELKRPDINSFQAVRLVNTKTIKYLDLTRPIYTDNLRTRDIYHYFMTWPLIACCSIKVSDYNSPFKSEYIIPQLLLQWIRENEELDGIKFNSTHIDFHNSNSQGDFSNLVLPVKESNELGLCNKLKSKFKISDSISWQMKEHAIGGQTFIYSSSDTSGVDKRIPKLELIRGRVYPYSYSALGMLESYLDGMDIFPIE